MMLNFNAIVLGYMSGARFSVVGEQFGYLSVAGIVIAVTLAVAGIVGAVTSRWWFPSLSKRLATHNGMRRFASRQYGWILPLSASFFLFPVSAFFSTSKFTIPIFFIFGWGMAAILLYYGKLIDTKAKQLSKLRHND